MTMIARKGVLTKFECFFCGDTYKETPLITFNTKDYDEDKFVCGNCRNSHEEDDLLGPIDNDEVIEIGDFSE